MAGARINVEPEVERIPENLLREPLDFIYADHFRQGAVCDMLDGLVETVQRRMGAETAAVVLGYLEHDLPMHMADEDEGLFPRLRAHCPNDERLGGMLDILEQEHSKDDLVAVGLIQQLSALVATGKPEDRDRFIKLASIFTETQRRHLAWENSVVLPLARQHLSPGDIVALGREMAERRGIPYPE